MISTDGKFLGDVADVGGFIADSLTWSPDGKWLSYCAERNGVYDVYKIPAEGGTEIQLTTAEGLDDGPEYSPDGKYIYFNSIR